MIIYGFLNFAFFSKNRDWKGARPTINSRVGSSLLPNYMIKYNSEHQFLSIGCIRYLEHMMSLNKGSIKWPFNASYQGSPWGLETKLKSSATGIYDPNYLKASGDNKQIGFDIPPFSDRNAKLLAVNMKEIDSVIDFSNTNENLAHKAYLLLLISCFTALGDRIFFEAVSNPQLFEATVYNEVQIYNLIFKNTKLGISSIAPQGTVSGVGNYFNARVYSLDSVLIQGYKNLLSNHPSLHIEDVQALIPAASKFVKNVRLGKV